MGPQRGARVRQPSDREFWHQDLLRYVLEVLDRHTLDANRLIVEVTEGVIMHRPEVALRLMRDMHDAGLRLHIDDFGTGYSSTGDHTAELLTAPVSMGRLLDLAVVAERVETAEQHASPLT